MDTMEAQATPVAPVSDPVQSPKGGPVPLSHRRTRFVVVLALVIAILGGGYLAYTYVAGTTPQSEPVISESPSPSASTSTSPTTPPAGWKGVYLGGFSFFLPPGWGLMGEESGEISPIEGDSYRSASYGIVVGQVGSSGDRLLEVNVFTDKNYYRKPGDSFEESIAALWRIQPEEGPGIKVGEYSAKAFSGSSSDPRIYFIADLGSWAIAIRSTIMREDIARVLATFQLTQ